MQKKEEFRVPRHYSMCTRVGNWIEELALMEEKRRVLRMKSKRGELMLQRLRKVHHNLLRAVELASESLHVKYGEPIQIKACDVPNLEQLTSQPNATGLYLSSLITEQHLNFCHLVDGAFLTASPIGQACVRNCFVPINPNGGRAGQSILMGEDFFFSVYESANKPLYIKCNVPTIDTTQGDRAHYQLNLTENPDYYCRFKIMDYNPHLKDICIGSNFTIQSKVLITHSATNRCLATEFNKLMPTFFGNVRTCFSVRGIAGLNCIFKECAVTCHNFLDSHRKFTAENMWKFVRGEDKTSFYKITTR